MLPGDLVFVSGELNYYFDDPADGVGHVGIATGQGTIVHAANSQVDIEEVDVSKFLQKGFRGAKRIIPQNSNVLTLSVPPDRDVESSDDIRWIIFGLTRKLRRKA